MCSLEHDTCANTFSTGPCTRQQKEKKKPQPQLKLNFLFAESRCNLLFYVLGRPPASYLGGRATEMSSAAYIFFCCVLWKSYLLILEVLLTKHALIYNLIQHKHFAAASLVITRPIHAQQAAVQAAPKPTRMDVFPPMCAPVNLESDSCGAACPRSWLATCVLIRGPESIGNSV